MANCRNMGTLTGRLVRDPVVFENRDGSHVVRATIAAQDNFYSNKAANGGKGEIEAQFIPVEQFFSNRAKGLGAWPMTHKGDQIQVQYTLRNSNYVDDKGDTQYRIAVAVESLALLETKAASTAHQAASAQGVPAAQFSATPTMPAPEGMDIFSNVPED